MNTHQNTPRNYKHFDNHLRILVNNKNRARKLWQRTRSQQDKTIMNNAQQDLKNYLRKKSNESWSNYLFNLTPSNNSIWKAARHFQGKFRNIPPLKNPVDNKPIYSDTEKAEKIAEALKNNFIPNPIGDPDLENSIAETVGNFNRAEIATPPVDVKPSEIVKIIKNLAKKKSPGEDGITNTMLKHLPLKYIFKITILIRSMLKLSYFPQQWRNSIIAPIHKAGKPPTNPNSYRPISLLCTISKIAEKFLANQINQHLEDNNIIVPYQFGFRKSLSAPHQAYRITELLTKSKQDKNITAAIFLDIAKAFDKVFIPGLLHKLINYNFPPHLIKILQSYLTNRTFQVRVNNIRSTKHDIHSGVPQGSLIGPSLFNLFINDLPQHYKNHIAIFADDTAIFATDKNLNFAIHYMNTHLETISDWMKKWRIHLNTEKSVAVCFTTKLMSTLQKDKNRIKLNNTLLPWAKETKYLGIILDKNLTWASHITHSINKYRAAKNLIYPLISRRSTLSVANKLLIYKSLLRSLLTYAAPAWTYAAKSHIQKLCSAQNITIKQITDSPYYVRSRQIHQELDLETLPQFLLKLNQNFHNSIDNELIKALTEYDHADPANIKRPMAALTRDYTVFR